MTSTPSGLTPSDVAAIRERAERATPGPWVHFRGARINEVHVNPKHAVVSWLGFDDPAFRAQHAPNAAFIAASRDDVPRLCAALEAAWAERDRMREALEEIVKREGPFSRDHQQHATNVIENMAGIAERALGGEG